MNGRGHPAPEKLVRVSEGVYEKPKRVFITSSRWEQFRVIVLRRYDEVKFLPNRHSPTGEVNERFGG